MNSYKGKNKLLQGAAAVAFFLVWFFCIQPVVNLIKLNSKLKNQQLSNTSNFSSSTEEMTNRSRILDYTIEKYQVDTTVWRNELWLKLSNLASQKKVDIYYRPDYDDRHSSPKPPLSQQVAFEGSFIQLVSVLDAAQKIEKIGIISQVSISRKNISGNNKFKIVMLITFYGLP